MLLSELKKEIDDILKNDGDGEVYFQVDSSLNILPVNNILFGRHKQQEVYKLTDMTYEDEYVVSNNNINENTDIKDV